MINYYRILELEDYSEISVVKRQYRKLAKIYHPDINKENPEAEEIIKIINKAHATLSDPKLKTRYDSLLKDAYLYEQFQQKRNIKDETAARRERAREFIKQKLKEDIKEFEQSLNRFPAKYRYGLGILSALTGLQLVYSNWFVNLTEQSYVLIFIGYLLFLTSTAFVFQFYDRHLWYKSQLFKARKAKPRINPVNVFLLTLFLGPAFTFGLSSVRKIYHLRHYKKIAAGRVLYIASENRVRYQFSSENGERVIKSQFMWNAIERISKDEVIYIEYSSADPGISRIIPFEKMRDK